MSLFKHGEWTTDDWRFVADDEPLPAVGPKIVTLARLQGDDGEYLFHCGCPLGVRLESGEPVEALEPWLNRLSLVALGFPAFVDGRAFSAAAILRQRHGFAGEIRAVGNVLVDQHAFMLRVGFDAFEVAEGRALESWRTALLDVPFAYQYDDTASTPVQSIWQARRSGSLQAGELQAAE